MSQNRITKLKLITRVAIEQKQEPQTQCYKLTGTNWNNKEIQQESGTQPNKHKKNRETKLKTMNIKHEHRSRKTIKKTGITINTNKLFCLHLN